MKRVRLHHLDHIVMGVPGEIGSGTNGGFQAVNLIAQFGVRRMVLVGFDMRVDKGVHWHGRHQGSLRNPAETTVAKWRRIMDEAAPALAALGIEVINASPISALRAYPRMTLEEALDADKALLAS